MNRSVLVTHLWLATFLALLLLVKEAQPQERILFRPLKYDPPTRNVDFRPVSDGERDPVVPWLVVAIKDQTKTTTGPGRGSHSKTLQFGERFFVVGENGNYLKIAKDERRADFHLSSRAEDYGWVNKEDVLMWQKALVSPESKIALKGMILNTTRALGRQRMDYHRIQAFKDPSMQTPASFEARLFEIFYIYRYSKSGDAVLLGRSPYFSERQQTVDETSGGLIGWVDLNRVLEWDHRVAIEPNFNADAVNERHARGIKSSIFSPVPGAREDECAREFMRGRLPSNCDIAWNDDIYDETGAFERKQGYWRRFPVIGDYGTDIYKLMVMGELRGETGVIREDVDMEVRKKLNELIEKVRNINVVFAIDGTSSMGPFYQSAINSVQRIVDIFETTGEDYKHLRFGYVVYRDYLERDRLLETRQLTTDSELIMEQLRRVDATDLYDVDTHEAMNYGLRAAISQIFTDPDETNILIHIGDAGNHDRNDPSFVSQNEIVDLLTEYKCYYIAYQAHHTRTHTAYEDFPRQIREIMSRASDKLYYEWVRLLGNEVIEQRPVLQQIDRNISRIDNGPPMVLIASERGREMDVRYLEDEITRAIEEIDHYTDNVVERAREMLERGGGINVIAGTTEGMYASSFAPGVYNFLVRMGLDEEVLKNYYSANVQIVVEGYASRNHASLSRPLFSPVLLLQSVEFASILMRVERLRTATQLSGDRREMLYDAWIELLKRHIGVKPDGFYDEISLEEASSMVFGVPLRSSMLQQIQLKDIHDRAIFPDTDLNRYINQIEFKSRQLTRIANTSNYPYSFISNDILYYWIDVDYLP